MAKKVTKATKTNVTKVQKSEEEDAKIFAFIATFLGIIGFLIAILTKKENQYVMYYAKQSLVIFLVLIVAGACMIVPIIGWIAGPIIYIIGVVLWIISWIYALSGEMKPVPIVGQYAEKFNF